MNRKKLLAWFCFIAWLLLIFFFSSQNGESSSGVSNGILKIIENIFNISLSAPWCKFFIRKLGHFSIYLILALLTINLVKQYYKITKKQFIIVAVFCLLYAISDEFHQSFVGGRSPQAMDVLIDFCGAILGCLIYKLFKIIRPVN